MSSQGNQEKRQASRTTVPVYIEAFTEAFPLGTLKNISAEGMFIQSTDPKEVGTRMELSFRVPRSGGKVQMTAEVVWVNHPPSFSDDASPVKGGRRPVDDNPGMGMRILSIAPGSKALLDEFIRGSAPAGSG